MTSTDSMIALNPAKSAATQVGSYEESVQLRRGHFTTLLFMNIQEFMGTCPTHRRWSHGVWGWREARFVVAVCKGTRQRKGCHDPITRM